MMPQPIPLVIHESTRPLTGWNDPVHGQINWCTLFDSEQTPTAGLTTGVAEIDPGGQFNCHYHAPPEAYYFLTGEGIVTINSVEYSVCAGSAVYIPGNALHGIRNTGPQPLRLFYAFAVDSLHDVAYVFPDSAIQQHQGR